MIISAVFATVVAFAEMAPRTKAYEVVAKGLGQLTFEASDGARFVFSLSYPDRGPYKGGIQRDEHQYISYGDRVGRMKAGKPLPPNTPYSNCVVQVSCKALKLDICSFLLPYFHTSYGLYSHEDVVRNMPFWREIYKLAPEREFTFTFVPDAVAERTCLYLDGSLLSATNAILDIVSVSASRGLEVVRSGQVRKRDVPGMYELPPLAEPSRANDLLMEGATLSIPEGEQTIEGVPMTVWPMSRSVDQGRHHRTSSRRSLCSDPQYDRTPWQTGYEYMQWCVPGRTWESVWVLCANVPTEKHEEVVGVQLAKLGQGCTGGTIDFERKSVAEERSDVKKVGTLTYGGGKTSPLYLVKIDLDPGRLGARGQGKLSLDFEFTGTGNTGDAAPSSVQIFGATLVEAPFSFGVDNPVRGNIFEQGTDEQKSVFTVTANRDDVKGTFDCEIYDPLFKTLEKRSIPFAISRRGETHRIELDLSRYDLGWYGMDTVFRDETGRVIANHEAAFTVLAPDDREAGLESPYAAWPHSGGYHGSNPDPMGPRTVMRKAGYRNSWEPPVASEEEGKPWKIGLNTLGYKCCQPGNPSKSRADFEKRMDNAVALIRGQSERFPHARVIQLLHEQGGREISKEVASGSKGVRGEYKGWKFEDEFPDLDAKERGEWDVFFCTEYSKRLRKEFPGKKIMIGNGSSACEKIASLCRRGFDLDLIDQLGIESKGFGTMPEYCANQESPGMLWALRETGRAFGYTNFTLNACNEYVFRTERKVGRDWSPHKIMSVTDLTLRDYLISMAHGCTIISTGHLEDAADAYYDTNWGAGGQCKAYPYSYPKRMFTGLAVLTRVLDCAKFIRRVPTDSNTAIVFEFERQRKVKDYVYAVWSPTHSTSVVLDFPNGTTVTEYQWDGRSCVRPRPFDGTESIFIAAGSSPTYIVSPVPLEKAYYSAPGLDSVPPGAKEVFRPTAESLDMLDEQVHDRRWYWGIPDATNGLFKVRTVKDQLHGDVLEVEHVKTDVKIPEVILEGCNFSLKTPVKLHLSQLKGFGMWIRGNSSYGKVKLLISKEGNPSPYEIECGDRGYVTFEGWHFVDMDLSEWTPPCGWLRGVDEVTLEKVQVCSTRVALDPLEMAPTKGDIAIGPIFAIPKAGATEISVETLQSRRAWENTEDKDR